MSEASFNPLSESGVVLNRTKLRLSTYTGEAIAVAGTADVQVEHKGQSFVPSHTHPRRRSLPAWSILSLSIEVKVASDFGSEVRATSTGCCGQSTQTCSKTSLDA